MLSVESKEFLIREASKVTFKKKLGRVTACLGLVIEVRGMYCSIGEHCRIYAGDKREFIYAEVVGFRDEVILLMPHGDIQGIKTGSLVESTNDKVHVVVSHEMIGRVIDAQGIPIDGGADLVALEKVFYGNGTINPLEREPIHKIFETGINSIDCCLTVGEGQRMGIFSGSGVGKSNLLSAVANQSDSDINIIVLVGERGREVNEFLVETLGLDGLAKSVVVVATADEHPLRRKMACYQGALLARFFCEQGKKVMLAMDSITRFSMACREIALAVGELPASRGYPPSALAELPKLLEMAGNFSHQGSITGFYTVLVEGDDFNEPVADAMRSILDGHVILDRDRANRGQFPAINLLMSNSRLMRKLVDDDEQRCALAVLSWLEEYRKSEAMINMGLYQRGQNPELDKAVEKMKILELFLYSATEKAMRRSEAIQQLKKIVRE